jgi:hypothetical protein
MAVAEREATADTSFDKLMLRKNIWKGHGEGSVRLEARECDCARVMAFLPAGKEVPWELWGRLFQWLGPSAAAVKASVTGAPKHSEKGHKWRIIWFASEVERKFPALGEELGPEHLNGGYTMPCNHEAVVVYRAEEGTRVLIHELLHAACLDPVDATIEIKEATIESWAELFLVALVGRGRPRQVAALWAKQAQWIRDVNDRARLHHGVTSPAAYGWRYMVGREGVLADLGVRLPPRASRRLPAESRFTTGLIHKD